jgi:acetyl-CoA carboxylase carboxyltransferase component
MVGRDAERSASSKRAKMVMAVSNSVVPKIVILGGSFGAGHYAMR